MHNGIDVECKRTILYNLPINELYSRAQQIDLCNTRCEIPVKIEQTRCKIHTTYRHTVKHGLTDRLACSCTVKCCPIHRFTVKYRPTYCTDRKHGLTHRLAVQHGPTDVRTCCNAWLDTPTCTCMSGRTDRVHVGDLHQQVRKSLQKNLPKT